jgi:hypothetical protein
MNIQGILRQDDNPGTASFGASVKKALKICGTFIYETPVWVVAAAIIGIALLILYPPLSAPFLGVAGAAVLSRITVKMIERFKPELLKEYREKMYEFQQKYPYIQYIAFIVSLGTAAICPIGGAVFAAAIGIYKGMVVEIDIFKYKQVVKREEFHIPISDSKLKMITR